MSSAENEVQTQKLHEYYNLEFLGGMPKELKWAFLYLNKYNLSKHLYIEELHNKSSEKKSNFQQEFEKNQLKITNLWRFVNYMQNSSELLLNLY